MSDDVEDGTMIGMEPTVHWCAAHLESFREGWPKGYVPASILVFNACTRLERVWTLCGNDAGRLNDVLTELAPLCCLIDEGLLSRIIGASLRFADDPVEWRAIRDELLRTEGS